MDHGESVFIKQPSLKVVHDAFGLWCEISRMMKYADVNRVLMWFDFCNYNCQWQTCVLLSVLFSMFSVQRCIIRAVMSNIFSRSATITFKSRYLDWALKTVAFLLLLGDCMVLPNESLYEYVWTYKHKFVRESCVLK